MLVGMASDTTYLNDLSDAEWEVVRPLLPVPRSARVAARVGTVGAPSSTPSSPSSTPCAPAHRLRLAPPSEGSACLADRVPLFQEVAPGWDVGAAAHPSARAAAHPAGARSSWGAIQLGRDPQPSAGIIDRQSVKTTGVGGLRGFDGGKQVKRRKRHVLVDSQGLLLTVSVHPAGIMDRDGVKLLLREPIPAPFPRLRPCPGSMRPTTGKRTARTGLNERWVGPRRSSPTRPDRRRSGFPAISHSTRLTGPSTCRRPVSGSCQGDGSWNGRLLGRGRTAG